MANKMGRMEGPLVVRDRPIDMRAELTPGLERARARDAVRIRELKLLIKRDGPESNK